MRTLRRFILDDEIHNVNIDEGEYCTYKSWKLSPTNLSGIAVRVHFPTFDIEGDIDASYLFSDLSELSIMATCCRFGVQPYSLVNEKIEKGLKLRMMKMSYGL